MKLALTLLCSALGPPHSARADLTVTVYPGYLFTSGETPTTSKLNRLGRPTVYVSGTLSGTNALGADSVTGTHLNPSVAGSNITFDAASSLVIANNGVGALQITNYMAGPGLAGGGGSIFTVLVDSNSIINLGDVIAVGTSLSNANLSATAAIQPSKLAFTSNTVFGATEYGTNGFLTLSGLTLSGTNLNAAGFTTAPDYTLTIGTSNSVPHGLSSTPLFVRWVLVCTNATHGYLPGDEIDVAAISDGTTQRPKFSFGANSSNLWCIVAENANFEIVNKINGTYQIITNTTQFRLKGYARQ